jgi:HK97 family phage prohead protease
MSEKYYGVSQEGLQFSEVEVKGEPKYYVSGFVSTKSIDAYNDVVSDECLQDMCDQIKSGNIKLDFEHETVLKENLDINPVGKIVHAEIKEVEVKKGEVKKGVWVKAEINNFNARFEEIWGSIKSGFLDAFSIAFKAIDTAYKYVKGKKIRLLNKIKLINVGITGNPVNEECKMDKVFMKALTGLGQPLDRTQNPESHSIGDKMAEEQEAVNEEPQEQAEEAESEQAEESKEVQEESESSESETEEKPEAEQKAMDESEEEEEEEKACDTKKDMKSDVLSEIKSEVSALKKENSELKAKIEKILKQPQMKAKQESVPAKKELNQKISPLGLIG